MKLGEKLISEGLINNDQLDKALSEQKSSGKKLGEILVGLGFITDDQLNSAL